MPVRKRLLHFMARLWPCHREPLSSPPSLPPDDDDDNDTASPSPSPPTESPPTSSRLLALPPELRNQIFHLALALPAAQTLLYTHPFAPYVPAATTLPDGTPHPRYEIVLRSLKRPFQSTAPPPPTAVSTFLLTNRQIYNEAVGMLCGLNTVEFLDLEHLKYFAAVQRTGRRAGGLSGMHSRSLRSIVLGVTFLSPAAMQRVLDEVVAFENLERMEFVLMNHALGEESEEQLVAFLNGGEGGQRALPRLRSWKLAVAMEVNGACDCCMRVGCTVWMTTTQEQIDWARAINGRIETVLNGR